MNKRLEKEFGECIAEKRGWHWFIDKLYHEFMGANRKNVICIKSALLHWFEKMF